MFTLSSNKTVTSKCNQFVTALLEYLTKVKLLTWMGTRSCDDHGQQASKSRSYIRSDYSMHAMIKSLLTHHEIPVPLLRDASLYDIPQE